MSTKINSRSPFYFTATEPTTTATFTCTTANLQGFSVSSNGNITEPVPQFGTIIARSHTVFTPALNVGDSNVSRTVTYTIRIPDGFSNSGQTIDCDVTTTQIAPTTCDASTNNNMLVFTGTIPDQTNVSSGSTINLGSFFTLGSSGATFKRYVIKRVGTNSFGVSLSDTTRTATVTFSTSNTCVSGTFYVRAFNNTDACFTDSNTFTVSSVCTAAFDCTVANLRNGILDPTGALVLPDRDGGELQDIIIKSIDGSTASPAGQSVLTRADQITHLAYTSGADRTVVLTFKFHVPRGYSNYGSGTTDVDCDHTFVQRASNLFNLACGVVNEGDPFIAFRNFRIGKNGVIQYEQDSVVLNDLSSTVISYRETVLEIKSVTTNISDGAGGFEPIFPLLTQAQANVSGSGREIRVTFKVPEASDFSSDPRTFSNAGQDLTCVIVRRQDISDNPCTDSGFFTFYLTPQGFAFPADFCDNEATHFTNFPVKIKANGPEISDITGGSQVCTFQSVAQNRQVVNGTSGSGSPLFWAVSRFFDQIGLSGSPFFVIKISENGTIESDPIRVDCG
tara:strand:- start:4946 stop:6634 length:1689 start_codon:yes stop_codon:yes gene_type:complete